MFRFHTIGKDERLHPSLDRSVAKDAKIEELATGFKWAEGPVWFSEGKYLLFSDIPNNAVMKWKEGEGISQFMKPAGYTGKKERGGKPGSNGLLLDREGRLVMCKHGDRRVSRVEKDGSKTTLADRYE